MCENIQICVDLFQGANSLFNHNEGCGTEIRSIEFGGLLSVGLEHFSRIFLLSIMLVTSAVLSRNSARKPFFSLVSLAGFPTAKFQPCQRNKLMATTKCDQAVSSI